MVRWEARKNGRRYSFNRTSSLPYSRLVKYRATNIGRKVARNSEKLRGERSQIPSSLGTWSGMLPNEKCSRWPAKKCTYVYSAGFTSRWNGRFPVNRELESTQTLDNKSQFTRPTFVHDRHPETFSSTTAIHTSYTNQRRLSCAVCTHCYTLGMVYTYVRKGWERDTGIGNEAALHRAFEKAEKAPPYQKFLFPRQRNFRGSRRRRLLSFHYVLISYYAMFQEETHLELQPAPIPPERVSAFRTTSRKKCHQSTTCATFISSQSRRRYGFSLSLR